MGDLGESYANPRHCRGFVYPFPFKHFVQDRNKLDEEKKNSSLTQLIMKCHLPHFPSFLHIIKSNNVTFNVFIISISKTSASQTSVIILEMLKMIIMMIMTMTAGCFFFCQSNCVQNPCKNNATCQSGFTKKGYRCFCTAGFEGLICERGKHNSNVDSLRLSV